MDMYPISNGTHPLIQARMSIIAAIGKNRELGKKNELIWHIHADMKRVKDITMGHPIIMGFNTYQSIGRPLPGRTNIVLSSKPIKIPGCVVCSSLEDAVAYAHSIEKEEIFIFGGARVYAAILPITDRLYLTRIDATEPKADAFFPEYIQFTKKISETKGVEGAISYAWIILEKE